MKKHPLHQTKRTKLSLTMFDTVPCEAYFTKQSSNFDLRAAKKKCKPGSVFPVEQESEE